MHWADDLDSLVQGNRHLTELVTDLIGGLILKMWSFADLLILLGYGHRPAKHERLCGVIHSDLLVLCKDNFISGFHSI